MSMIFKIRCQITVSNYTQLIAKSNEKLFA